MWSGPVSGRKPIMSVLSQQLIAVLVSRSHREGGTGDTTMPYLVGQLHHGQGHGALTVSRYILIEPKVFSDAVDVVLVSAREVGGQHVCGGGAGRPGAHTDHLQAGPDGACREVPPGGVQHACLQHAQRPGEARLQVSGQTGCEVL